jgi:phosphatidylethanolamine/phosphatidyl-N-methylethanolamine N-methyltransferase
MGLSLKQPLVMQHKTTAFYNKLAPVYPIINVFLKPHRSALIKKINGCPTGKLLEIGIGTGSHLPLYNNHDITGIDISSAMLQKAERYKGDSVQLVEMNGESLDFRDEAFDYVVLSHVIAVTERPGRMLNEVYRVLKPGGKLFILNHFTPDNALKYVDKLFSPISKWFHFKSLFYQDDLGTLKRFSVVEQENMGKLSYFKIIILQKP